MTFQCEPLFNLEETLSVVPLEVCLSDMERLVHSAQYVKMWVEVFSGTCALHQTNRTQEEPRDNPSSLVGTAEVGDCFAENGCLVIILGAVDIR